MRCLIFALLSLVLASSLLANIINVPDDQSTIQGGISSAATGDTVMVSPGIYHEYDINFLGKAITVMGTDPEDSIVVAATIVDADSLGRVFIFWSNEDSSSVLAGLTITGGNATDGGGIYCGPNSSPTITDNIITGNTANDGGAIDCHESSPTISNNHISRNSAGSSGGGIFAFSFSNPLITNNTIVENHSMFRGGGINTENSSPIIVGNFLRGNSSAYGGGLHFTNSYPNEVICNVIVGNFAGSNGGGVDINFCSPLLINNTISGNWAGSQGGGLATNSDPEVRDAILWSNSAPNGNEVSLIANANPRFTYCDVHGGWPGEGNIDANPLFISPDFNNYHLRWNSPCIDTGDPSILDACLPPGLGAERSDMGAYGGQENCDWAVLPGVSFVITATGTTTIPRGEILYFNTYIQNNRQTTIEGDYWLSVLFPDSNEVFISETLLNYPNPLHGQIFPYGFVNLSNELWVHPSADTGSYQLIGRIGSYPDTIIDEESFGFHVVE